MTNGCFPKRKFHVSGNPQAQLRRQRVGCQRKHKRTLSQAATMYLSYPTCTILEKLLSRPRTAAKARGGQYEAGKLVRAGEPGLALTITKSQL